MLGSSCSNCCCPPPFVFRSATLMLDLEVVSPGTLVYGPTASSTSQLAVGQKLASIAYGNLVVDRLSVAYLNTQTVAPAFAPIGEHEFRPINRSTAETLSSELSSIESAWNASSASVDSIDTNKSEYLYWTNPLYNLGYFNRTSGIYRQDFTFSAFGKILIEITPKGESSFCTTSSSSCFQVRLFMFSSSTMTLTNRISDPASETPDIVRVNPTVTATASGFVGLSNEGSDSQSTFARCITASEQTLFISSQLGAGLESYPLTGATLADPPVFRLSGSLRLRYNA